MTTMPLSTSIPYQLDVTALLAHIKEHDGITISIVTGERPTQGYAVSIPGHEYRSRWTLSAAQLGQYIVDHMEALVHEGAHLGAWWDDDDDTWYLDVSIVVGDLDEALRLGAQWSQLAVYDLARKLPRLVPQWMVTGIDVGYVP